jgi:hypothetical protein
VQSPHERGSSCSFKASQSAESGYLQYFLWDENIEFSSIHGPEDFEGRFLNKIEKYVEGLLKAFRKEEMMDFQKQLVEASATQRADKRLGTRTLQRYPVNHGFNPDLYTSCAETRSPCLAASRPLRFNWFVLPSITRTLTTLQC